MAIQTLNTIKNWFKTGFKPTQQQFWDTWDSFWHKDAVIPAANIENLDARFQEKTDQDAFVSHLMDQTAHGLAHKAGLDSVNHFSGENTFSLPVQTPQAFTNTGMAFNLSLANQISDQGFAGKLSFNPVSGILKFDTTSNLQQSGETPAYGNSPLTVYPGGDIELPGTLTATALTLETNQQEQRLTTALTAPETDTQLYFPPKSGTIARIEDLPVIKAGSNITITGKYPEVIINATSATPISLNHSELFNLSFKGNLVPGQQYLINDFQSSFFYIEHTITGEGDAKVESVDTSLESYYGAIEPIIVIATTRTALSSLARSTVYDTDELIYSLSDYGRGFIAPGKGAILRRTDTLLNNTADFDYRVCQYRTNGGPLKPMVKLLGNCTITSNGATIVIGEMKDSQLTISTSTEAKKYDHVLNKVYHSILMMPKNGIVSSNLSIESCEMRWIGFSVNKNYAASEVTLKYIYTNVSQGTNQIDDQMMMRHLANKDYPSYVVQAGDGSLLLQNNTLNGVTTTPLI